uniref:Rtn protein n=1 Tax=Heterorhabditis bacteriophora TaxID=37862 RepID=A0A1I7X832_HETBA
MRCRMRKQLFIRRNKGHNVSILLRSLCVITTVCLMACLIHYHAIEVSSIRIDHNTIFVMKK